MKAQEPTSRRGMILHQSVATVPSTPGRRVPRVEGPLPRRIVATRQKWLSRNLIQGVLFSHNFGASALITTCISSDLALPSGPTRTRMRSGPRLVPEVTITIPSSSQRQGDEISVTSTQRTPSEAGSIAPSRKRKQYKVGGSDSPALNTRSRIKDVAETSSQPSHSSPPVSASSYGSESGRRYTLARQLGSSKQRTSTSIPSPPPKPPPLRPYVSIPSTSSFHHHKGVPTTEPTSEKRPRSSSVMDTPITRSHCRFHKISVPSGELGRRTYFIVPGCSFGATDLMKEENITDCGAATDEDNASKVTDLSKLDPSLVHILRKLAGPDLIHEGVCGFLPSVSMSEGPVRPLSSTECPEDLEGKDIESTSRRSPKPMGHRARHRKPRQSDPLSDLADYEPSSDQSSNDESHPMHKSKRAQLREAMSSRMEAELIEQFPVDLTDTFLTRESSPKETEPVAKPTGDDVREQESSDHEVPPTSRTKRKRQSRDPGSRPSESEESEEDENEKLRGKKHRRKSVTNITQWPNSEEDESTKGKLKEGMREYSNDTSEDRSTPISERLEAKPSDTVSKPGRLWRRWW